MPDYLGEQQRKTKDKAGKEEEKEFQGINSIFFN
jgi:hypothetical protein